MPFSEKPLFSFLSVFDYCCKTKSEFTQQKRAGPAPQSLQTCIWQHSGSTDLAQTANKSQSSELHSFKSHCCSHSWLNSSAFISNGKKGVQAALNNFQTFPSPSEHFNPIIRLLCVVPLKWVWLLLFFFIGQKSLQLMPTGYFCNLLKEIFCMY